MQSGNTHLAGAAALASALLFSDEAFATNCVYASSGFANLIMTLLWLFGFGLTACGLVKIWKLRMKKGDAAYAKLKANAFGCLLSGAIMFGLPFLAQAFWVGAADSRIKYYPVLVLFGIAATVLFAVKPMSNRMYMIVTGTVGLIAVATLAYPHARLSFMEHQSLSGDIEAQVALGDYYLISDLPEVQNPVEAVKWYRMAAERGDTTAAIRAGDIYREVPQNPCGEPAGWRSIQNDSEAMKWYRMAVEKGDTRAFVRMGDLYANEGFPSWIKHGYNIDDAIKWYIGAANKGDAVAMERLMAISKKKRDYEDAWNWRTKAIEHGNTMLACLQGDMYANGSKEFSIEKNDEDAYFWFTHCNAPYLAESAAKKLSPGQLAEAEGRVREWRQMTRPPSGYWFPNISYMGSKIGNYPANKSNR